jgi:conjugative relaxase-like TrwC/TraI family protein
MLRIHQQSSAKDAQRYYATADYYSEGQELIGLWGGKAAERLGLSGQVDKASFDSLCENRDPRDGSKLTVRNKSQRTVGYDFTFSVPKSVSLLYGHTEDKGILAAFRGAVDDTMREIESEMQTRVRVANNDYSRVTGNMVWAEFIHKTSRPVDGVPDPQLHSHVFVFNATWDQSECRFKAGFFRDLKRDAPYFQAAFRVRLAGKLQELGFGVDRKRDDFEITGVPLSAVRKFSRRTDKIEKLAEELGITDPKRKAELGQQTREKKCLALTWNDLRRAWKERLTGEEDNAIAETNRRKGPGVRVRGGERESVDYALEHCFVREAVVPERKLLTEALQRGVGSVDLEAVRRELANRPLIRGEQGGRVWATSKAMLDAEKQMDAYAKKGRGRYRPLGDSERPMVREWLNDGQQRAVRHILGSRDAVTIVRGVAGTGKTSLEAELRDAFAEKGVPVAAMAQTTSARDELRSEAGFDDAMTVAAFLRNKELQLSARHGVLLIDEAGFLGTKDMLKLFEAARDLEARVVLVGDKRQHRSVSAGEPLRLLEENAGLPVAEVRQIMRQTHGDYKKAAEALSEGRVDDGFDELNRLGWIHEIGNGERYQALAKAYLAATRERKKNGKEKTALVVSPTHAEVNRIQQTIRSELKAEGKLAGEREFDVWIPAQLTDAEKSDAVNIAPGDLLKFHQHSAGHPSGSRWVVGEGQGAPVDYADRFEVYRPGRLKLAAGDRIRITANGKDKTGKQDLTNGTLLTVKGFTRHGDVIADNGRIIARDWGHIAHGYAVTSHASQGKTVDKVLIGLSSDSFPAASQRSFYVQATRGREKAEIFTDDKAALLQAVRRPDQPLSAMELAKRRRPVHGFYKRLKKHLAFVRRAVNLHPVREQRPSERSLGHHQQRERHYAR